MHLSLSFLTFLLSITSIIEAQRVPDLKNEGSGVKEAKEARKKSSRDRGSPAMKDLGNGVVGHLVTPRKNKIDGTAEQVHEFTNSFGGGSYDITSKKWNPGHRLKRLDDFSWRGLENEEGRLNGWDVSGFAQALPGNQDYIRLLPAESLKHGAIYSSQPFLPKASGGKKYVKDWVMEVAFRVHGPQSLGLGSNEEGLRSVRKGGRGMAMWYTKAGSPTPPTIPSDPKFPANEPPPAALQYPTDPDDNNVSLFGNRVDFEGLGIVFDTSPAIPLFMRSNRKSWRAQALNKEQNIRGAVSGILDDGSGGGEEKWFDDVREWGLQGYKSNEPKPDTSKMEPKYLSKTFGECDAAFRNTPGLVYARISHANDTIRVDMDLSPHTSLAQGSRRYDSHCLTLEGVKLPEGYRFGISALASASGEPDMVDIYAVDIYEILQNDYSDEVVEEMELKDQAENSDVVLEGTTNSEDESLVHEVLNGQAAMVAILEDLKTRVYDLTGEAPSGNSGSSSRLSSVEEKLNLLLDSLDGDGGKKKGGSSMLANRLSTNIEMVGKMSNEIKAIRDDISGMKDSYTASLKKIESKQSEMNAMMKGITKKIESLEKSSTKLAVNTEKSMFATKRLVPIGIVGIAVVGMFALWLASLRKEKWNKKLV